MDERFGVREVVRSLSQEPARTWPHGVIHHGVRFTLLVGIAFVVHLLFPVAPVPDFPVLEKGMVAEADIIAEVGFPLLKSEAELARERADAAAGVAPIFEYVPAAIDTMNARVGEFLALVDTTLAQAPDPASGRAELRRLLQAHGLPADPPTLEILAAQRSRAMLERALASAIRAELPVGIAATADAEEYSTTQLRLRRDDRETLLGRDSLLTAPDFYERAARHLSPSGAAELAELQRLILIRFFEPSIRLDRDATEAARERARRAVPVTKGEVLKGEKIVGAHEQIREAELERIQAYRQQLTELGQFEEGASRAGRSIGAFLFNAAILLVVGAQLYYYRRDLYRDLRHLLVIASLIVSLAAAAAVVIGGEWPTELIPIAFPALVVAALWDGRMAVSLVLALAVLLNGQAPFGGLSVLFTLVMGGSAAGLGARVIQRRSKTWFFIALIAAAYIAAAIILGLLRSREAAEIVSSMLWGTVNAVVSVLIAIGFLPLFESLTKITTRQTLLELSDMNHPLLQRMQREAPGTFAHSLNVANLSEAAARAIHADALLTRVGVYYHDIGKILKPQYYIENQPPGRNPHDKLKPATSAAIVRGHVVEGLRMAEEAKLPERIRDFIAEHHGTQTISFFYERARELDPEAELNERDFSYPGPRPRSKETAIVMLADSVESAARVLQDPTRERIAALVDRIVEAKIQADQLDDAPLTLRDLHIVKEQFVTGLAGIYHQRIDYPTMRDEPAEAETAAAGEPVGSH